MDADALVDWSLLDAHLSHRRAAQEQRRLALDSEDARLSRLEAELDARRAELVIAHRDLIATRDELVGLDEALAVFAGQADTLLGMLRDRTSRYVEAAAGERGGEPG